MAEIQHSPQAGELAQQFIEFVMMQAQQAALCLGQIPHPSTGKAEINLDAARMFIDHLEVIREKTRGNLSKDEDKILTSVLSELQMAFVRVASKGGDAGYQGSHDEVTEAEREPIEEATSAIEASPAHDAPIPPQTSPSLGSNAIESALGEENKKRFTKSYGA